MRRFNQSNLNQFREISSIYVDGQTYSIEPKFTKIFEINQESAQDMDKITPNYKKGNKVTQVFNVILQNIMEKEGYKQMGRNSNFFDLRSNNEVIIQNNNSTRSKIEIYKGFSSKVSPTQQNLYLNIDLCFRIFRQETALEYMSRHDIVGQTVITKYNNYQTYKIERIDENKNPNSSFLYKKTNQQISFVEYYMKNYNIQIRNMQQELLVTLRKYRDPKTNIQKIEEVFLIPELCQMTGLTDGQRKDRNAMKEIANYTKLTPNQRYQQTIQNCILLRQKARQSGININHTDNKINAIQLKAPKVTFFQRCLVPERGGNFDIRFPILDKVQFKDWLIIFNNQDKRNVQKLVENLKSVSQTFGIDIQEPILLDIRDYNPQNWIEILDEEFIQNGLPQFVVTFSRDDQNLSLYSELKKFFSSKDGAGIESQNVTPKALLNPKTAKSVASKIILQIASKLGKRIWSIENPVGINQNIMIIGIETSMKTINNQQIIGVVASINKDFTKYYSEVDIRNKKDTTLPTLSNIIKNAIASYSKNTNTVPEEIIIYRQGLGEGQIMQSHQLEVKAIQNGFKNFNERYNPRFAFFQVNRKVGQKFYQQANGEREEIQNPLSGTIVATEVVQNNFEFFMNAQNCNSGVCTPTKYICLYNNTNLKEDQFWQLTYFQTFNYYNWQGPIRVPAVMKYAEKLAKYTSDTILGAAHEDLTNSLYYL
ncbi:hypothetical protein ABPG72_001535 [Tetrahymena utriculariae]